MPCIFSNTVLRNVFSIIEVSYPQMELMDHYYARQATMVCKIIKVSINPNLIFYFLSFVSFIWYLIENLRFKK